MNTITNIEQAEQVINKDFVMIIAKSHSCTVCNTIQNVMEHSISNLKDIEQHIIYIDDVDEFRGQHTIFTVPTVLIFSDGKELLRESRYINYGKIQRLIDLYKS